MPEKRVIETWLVEIFYIFILPIALLYFGILGGEWRVTLLLIASLLIYGIIRHNNWSRSMVGIKHSSRKEVIAYLLFTIAGVAVIYFAAQYLDYHPQSEWWRNSHFFFWFLPLSFYQEFVYRGFLMTLLRRAFTSPLIIIFVNALLFALLHVIYPFPSIMIPLSLIGGLGFAAIYYKYPNLLLVSIAHAVLNFVAVLYGFFSYFK